MSQCCLVCNGRMGVKQRLATNIFKEKTTSGKGLSDVLSEILDKSLPATALYSDVICKRCHRTCSEYEAAKERIQQLKSDLISQFKATLPNHNLAYETIWETKSPKDGNTDRRVGKRVVLPASKLQPLPPDYVIDVTKLASGLVSNKATKITNTITPILTNSMKTSPKTSSFKPTKMQDLVTNIIQDITQSSSDTKSLCFNAVPKDILASAVLAKLNSNINEKKDVGASDSMEIDEDCTPGDVSDELQVNSNASQSEFLDLAASDSEGRSAGDELELRELRVLNDEDEDDEETIVMSAENGSILRVVRGQTLVYKGGKMALRDGSEPADDPEQDAGNESNDDSQIELQVSGDEETANAIIAAAQEKGGAFIKVESGEMFRVKSVRSKTEAEPTTTVKEPPPIVERDGDIFKCLICENIGKGAECRTRDPSEIARHARACHRARVYVCSRCYAVSRRHDAHIVHTKQCWKHKEKHSKTPTEKRVHECDICLKTYNSRALLAEHANVHSGARPYACPACAKKFASKYTLQAHLKTHQDRPRPYQCSLCLKTFLTTTNLKQHENTHSSDRHFVCTECGKAFASQHSLEVHGVVHSGSKPFVCGVCGKAFARRAEVRDHMRTHTGERPFECEQCGASFAQRSNLHTHRRATHMNDRPYHCAHCDKRFKRRRLLEYHIKATHTGERPLECEVCHATFVYPEHYKKHVRGHSGERPFECEVCGKTFNSRDNRNTHRFVHSDKKPYECLVCGAGYMRKQLLYAHMNTSGHLAESIVVNQPRVQVTETAVTSVPSEIVDSIKINPDNTESAVLQLNAENDKPIDTKVNVVQGSDDQLLLSIHTPSDITKSEPGAMQEITLDPTQMVATTEGGSVMRLVQIQLENGASGWVAINE